MTSTDTLPHIDAANLPSLQIAGQWLTDIDDARGCASHPLDYTADLAVHKAREYVKNGTAYADFQPGNGTGYVIVLHDLLRLQAEALPRSRQTIARLVSEGMLPPVISALTDRECREIVVTRGLGGPYGVLGGRLLVALPQNRGGVSSVFNLGIHFPYYVDERLRLGAGDAPFVAVFLTLFCDAVTLLEAAR